MLQVMFTTKICISCTHGCVYKHIVFGNHYTYNVHLHISFAFTIVICEPPCEQGACVANDTCNCIAGYAGKRCTQPGYYNFL